MSNPNVKDALHSSQQRIHSMALIHEHLYGNDRLDRIDFAEYAAQLYAACTRCWRRRRTLSSSN